MALTNGQIAGISVGVVLFVIFVICVPLYCYLTWKKRRRAAGYESEGNAQPTTGPPPPSEKKGTENPGYEIGEEVNGAVNHGKTPDNGVARSNGPVSVEVSETPAKVEIETQQNSPQKPEEITLDIPEEPAASQSPDVARDSDSLSRFSLTSDIDLDNISLKMRGLGDTDDILSSVMSVKSPFNFADESVNNGAEVTPEVKGDSNRLFDFDSIMSDSKSPENRKIPEAATERSNILEDRSKLYQVSDIPGNDLAPKENLNFDLERSDSISLSSASSKETIIEMPSYAQRDIPHLEQNGIRGDMFDSFGEEMTLSDLEQDLKSWQSEQPIVEAIEPHEVEQVVLQRAEISEVEIREKGDQTRDEPNEPEVQIKIEEAEVDQSDVQPDDVIPNGYDVEPMTLGVEMISDSDSGSDVPACTIAMPAEDSSSTDASAGENDGTVSVQIPERTSVTDDVVIESPSFDKTPPSIMDDSFEKSILSTLDSSVPKKETPSLNVESEVSTLSFRSKDGVDDDSVSISSVSSSSSSGSKGEVLKESLAVGESHSPPFSPITPLRKRFFSDTPEIEMTSSPLKDNVKREAETSEVKATKESDPPWKTFDLSPISKKEMNLEPSLATENNDSSSQVVVESPSGREVTKVDEQFEEKILTFARSGETRGVVDSAISDSSSESGMSNVGSSASEHPSSTEAPLEQAKSTLEKAQVEDKPTFQKQEEPTVVKDSSTFGSILDRSNVGNTISEPSAKTPDVGIHGDPTDDVVSSVGSALSSWRTRKPWKTRGGSRFDDDSSSGRSTPEAEKTKDVSFFSSLLGSTKEETMKDIRSEKKRAEVPRSDSRTPRFKYKGMLRTFEDEDEDSKGVASSPTLSLVARLAAKTETNVERPETQPESSKEQTEEKPSESSNFDVPPRRSRDLNGHTTAENEDAVETPPKRRIDDIIQQLNKGKSVDRTANQSPRLEPEPPTVGAPSRPPLPRPDHLSPAQRQLAQPGRPPLPTTANLNRTESYKSLSLEQQSLVESAKSTSTPKTTLEEIQEKTPSVAEMLTPKVHEVTPNVPEATPKHPEVTPKVPETAPKDPEMTPKLAETPPKVSETIPKIPETTPKVAETFPKVPDTTPKATETRKLPERTPARTPGSSSVSKLSPARLSPYTAVPFSRERHTSPTTKTPPTYGVTKGRRPRGVARFMSSSSNPLFHAAMSLNDEENKKNSPPSTSQKKGVTGSQENGRSSSPTVASQPKTIVASQEQPSIPATTVKAAKETDSVKAPPRRSRGSDPPKNGTTDARAHSALLRTPSSVSRASEDGSEYGEAVSSALDDAFAMLDDI